MSRRRSNQRHRPRGTSRPNRSGSDTPNTARRCAIARSTFVTPTITASGTTWAQYKTGGLKIQIDNLVTANAAKANPTVAATHAETVASGGLASGTYYASYTWLDAFGETLVGASRSSAITVTDASHLTTLTIPSLPTGCQSANIYLTQPGGAAGTETLFATGITATTFGLTDSLWVDVPGAGIPASNTTGATMHSAKIYAIFEQGVSEGILGTLTEELSNYLSGDPIERKEIIRRHSAWCGILKLWYTALSEINVLIAANQPTALAGTFTPIGMPTNHWTLP